MSNQTTSALETVGLSRRTLLLGAAVAPLAGLALAGAARAENAHNHAHQHGAGDDMRSRLAAEAAECERRGRICMQHCIELFKQGDLSTAGCADMVQQMMAACAALSQLATSGSRHLAAMTEVCMSVCEDCEKECRKHELKHTACKDCADSCRDCIKLCKASLGRA